MKKLLYLITYLKPYWKETIFSIILLIGTVVMDLSIPRLVQKIIDVGIANSDMQAVISTSLIMLGISFIDTLFSIGNNTLSVRASEGFARDLRDDLFLKIQHFSYGNIDRIKTGNLIVRLTSDIQMVQQTYRMSIRIGIRAPLLMIGSIILMFYTDANLSLQILPVLLATGLIIGFLIVKMGPMFLEIQKKLDKLNTVLQENIAGIRLVKAFVRQAHEEERFETVNQDFTKVNIDVLRIVSAIFPGLMFFVSLGTLIVIWYGGRQVIGGSLSVGQIVAFTNYLSTTLVPLTIMGNLAGVVASGIASAERIDEVLTEAPEILDKPGSISLPEKILGRVEFENVSFYYNGKCEEKVLDGINLAVDPGQTVAILGATGSGKTTLVNLIPRFYDVSEGRILIDGIDIRDIKQDSLLANIAITPQETILFSGTVRENIAYGRPDASEEEVVEAAEASQAQEFIMELPDKYETSIAARGVNLSGGQKQRIAIARAILLKPAILILDDSTSSVDVETEVKIQDALKQIMKGTTTFMVAQRISTVLTADKIVVIDKGKIAAEGTHHELMQSSKIYKEIYDSQLGEGDNLKTLRAGSLISGATIDGN
jgi:ATP-binding cassette, subfamily B, multidrug efflux pump